MVSLPVRAHHHPPPLSGHAASGERWGFRVWPGLVAESGGVLLRACVTTACCEGPERAPFPGRPLLRRVAQGPTPPACASLDGLVVALTCGHSLAVLHPASCGPGPRKVRQRPLRGRFMASPCPFSVDVVLRVQMSYAPTLAYGRTPNRVPPLSTLRLATWKLLRVASCLPLSLRYACAVWARDPG
jgi:hypothetical protein